MQSLGNGKLAIGMMCVCVASFAWARTGTVTMEKEGESFVATFANHAHETNGLWVCYGSLDCGQGQAGWDHAEFLQTVYPETTSVEYPVPAGWGESVKAFRFVLSEVPYDYDYSLDFLRSGKSGGSGGSQRICLSDFTMNGAYRVETRFRLVQKPSSGNQTVFSTRAVQGGGKPFFTLFLIGGTSWRFDYNDVNGNSASGVTTDVIYDTEASGTGGLKVDGVQKLDPKGESFATDVDGKLEFFCANQAAESMSNASGQMDLFGAKVYAPSDSGAELLVNLVPMVKNGKGGMYDTARNKFYYSDTGKDFDISYGSSRVESANPYFASAVSKIDVEGPTVFAPNAPVTDAESYANPLGGLMVGVSALTLTGANDWGGKFVVSNGALVATFGQGLGSNDHLSLMGEGSYGGWNGWATNTFGPGPGQISFGGDNAYRSFSAVGGDLHVDIGGEGAPWVLTDDDRRLRLNNWASDDNVTGVVYFDNPIILPTGGESFILRNRRGDSVLTAPFAVESVTDASMFDVYNSISSGDTPPGTTTLAAPSNSFSAVRVNSGGLTFGSGSTNEVSGQFNVLGGRVTIASGALVRMTQFVHSNDDPSSYFKGGLVRIEKGGEYTGGCIYIGDSDMGKSAGSLFVDGKVTLVNMTRYNAEGAEDGVTYGTPQIRYGAASTALEIGTNAEMQVQNFRFKRRNIIQRGGLLRLNGGTGMIDMGERGTARYQLLGGRLEAPRFVQTSVADASDHIAQFLFSGGTLAITSAGSGHVIFGDFSPKSGIAVNAGDGGTLETDYPVSITNRIISRKELMSVVDSWNYAASDYLTAPAFVKTGAGTLTLSATNCSYLCATDVKAGTLKLGTFSNPVLPTDNVVRVTGGTLDLGGNDQTLKAICGTAGTVENGSVTVTEGVYPGGAGAIGSFTCNAALSGTLYIDVDDTGAADSLVTTEKLDLSNIDLRITAPQVVPEIPRRLKIVNGPYAGTFKGMAGALPIGWTLRYTSAGVSIGPERGTLLIVR